MDSQTKKLIADLEKRLNQLAEPASKAAKPQNIFGGWVPRGATRENEWPVEQLKRLADAYDSEAAAHMLFHNGRGRGIGWGPALKRMGEMASPGHRSNYGPENLEREHNFVSVQKAAREGIKGLSGEVRKVALAEQSGVTGGYVVPPQFMNELLTIAAEDAVIEPRAKVIPMTTRTATWPMLDITTNQGTGVSPYFGGIVAEWQPEASTINETEPTFRQTEWTAWDLVLYTVSSNQLLQDNGIGLDALLTQLFAQAITWYKEYAFLQGLGAGNSMPLGILNAPATYSQSRTTSSTFLLSDAANMFSRLQMRSMDNACWMMHQSVIPKLIQMASNVVANTSPANLVWMTPFGNDKMGPAAMKLPQAFLHGLPLYFTEKLPQIGSAGSVVLADWSRYVIGMRLDMQIDVSPHYLFRNNQLAWRVVCRLDGKPWLNSTITDAAGYEVSPFISLAA